MTSFDLISAYRAGFRRGVATDCAAGDAPAALAVLGVPVNETTVECFNAGLDDGILGLASFYEQVVGMVAGARSR